MANPVERLEGELAAARAELAACRRRCTQGGIDQFRLAEAVFTKSISCLVVLDRDYNFLRVNEAYARACNRAPEELVGRNHFELYPSDAREIFDEVVRTQRPFTVLARPFVFPDRPELGTTWWDWTLVPVLDESGEVEYLVFSLVDVTERERAGEALRASEARYRRQAAELELIYRSAPVGLCVLDTALRFVHINERLAEINGVAPEHHIGRTVREVVPQIADRAEPLLLRVLETGVPVLDFELTAETPAQPGVQRTWVSQYWPLVGSDGAVLGINVVAEEITERRRAEEIARREKEFRTLAENSTDIVARFDRSLRRVYVNPAIEALLCGSRAELIGRTHREIGLSDALSDQLADKLKEVFATGRPATMEIRLPTPRGERSLDSRLVPELGPDGEIETLLAITRDITELKQAEEALRKRETELLEAQRVAEVGSWSWDAASDRFEWSEELHRIHCHAPREPLAGMEGLRHFFTPQSFQRLSDASRHTLETGEPYEIDLELVCSDCEGKWTIGRGEAVRDSGGRIVGMRGTEVDVTPRKRAEEALLAHARDQDFLVDTALELLRPLALPELFSLIAERVCALADGGIVLVSEFDPERLQTIVRAMGCAAGQRAAAARLLGRDPIGLTLDFPSEIRAQMLPGELKRLAGGICELAFYRLPQALCSALERELEVGAVFAMACSVEQDLLGTIAVLARTPDLRHKRLIEAVVTQSALALKRKRAEETLKSERNFFDTVLDTQGAMVVILDREFRVMRLNRAYYELTGFRPGEKLGEPFRNLLPEASDAEAVMRRLEALPGRHAGGELETALKVEGPAARYVSWRTTVLRDSAGSIENVIATGIDVTERKQMEERSRHLAEHDALTNLPNRRLLLELLDAELRKAQRSRRKFALLFLDLDRFKSINDSLGHAAGDALLREVSQRLQERARRADIVARLGGDEFTVLLGDLAQGEQAREVAAAVIRSFARPFRLEGQLLYVTTSVGISVYPDDSDTPEGLLRCADLAMYDAKEQGRNTYRFYNPAVDRQAHERIQVENSLRRALTGDELCLLYQPEIDLRSGRMVGVEALVRWRHPELGLIDPARFVPVAEEIGLIMALDDWVLRTSCRQAGGWARDGVGLDCVSVNLSARRFESPDLVETVARNLAESGLGAGVLELELTESTAMRSIEQTIGRMRELVEMGVRIAIDDFGTGYSSLGYLKQLPIGRLKIDRSFVRDIDSDADDRAIVRAVTALAHTLNKRVTAEGVENEAQRRFLDGIGCDEAQGFLFSRPLPPERISELGRR